MRVEKAHETIEEESSHRSRTGGFLTAASTTDPNKREGFYSPS